MSSARSSLRTLLRAVDRHLTNASGNPRWKNYVLEEYRSNTNVQSHSDAAGLIQKAEDYARLLNAVHFHKDTLISYNISMNRESDQLKKVEQTAKRVGFKLPGESTS